MLATFPMKRISAISAVIVLGLAACDTMNRPITSGEFDPLRPPGSGRAPAAPGVTYAAGQFVKAAMDNTAFFKSRPKGDMDADKLITRGSSMKVISQTDSYVKVELDSGEIGYVPSVMLENPNAAAGGSLPRSGEIQIYPPLDGSNQPLPLVTPAEQPPEGAIPTVIDPEAPAVTEPFTAPEPPKTGPAPLPPNGEEDAAWKKTTKE
jgi:hypothetical protein